MRVVFSLLSPNNPKLQPPLYTPNRHPNIIKSIYLLHESTLPFSPHTFPYISYKIYFGLEDFSQFLRDLFSLLTHSLCVESSEDKRTFRGSNYLCNAFEDGVSIAYRDIGEDDIDKDAQKLDLCKELYFIFVEKRGPWVFALDYLFQKCDEPLWTEGMYFILGRDDWFAKPVSGGFFLGIRDFESEPEVSNNDMIVENRVRFGKEKGIVVTLFQMFEFMPIRLEGFRMVNLSKELIYSGLGDSFTKIWGEDVTTMRVVTLHWELKAIFLDYLTGISVMIAMDTEVIQGESFTPSKDVHFKHLDFKSTVSAGFIMKWVFVVEEKFSILGYGVESQQGSHKNVLSSIVMTRASIACKMWGFIYGGVVIFKAWTGLLLSECRPKMARVRKFLGHCNTKFEEDNVEGELVHVTGDIYFVKLEQFVNRGNSLHPQICMGEPMGLLDFNWDMEYMNNVPKLSDAIQHREKGTLLLGIKRPGSSVSRKKKKVETYAAFRCGRGVFSDGEQENGGDSTH